MTVLSIWEDTWSLGEGGGVPDEKLFVRRFLDNGVEIDFLIPEPPGDLSSREETGLHYHTYPNIFKSFSGMPGPVSRLLVPALFDSKVRGPLLGLARSTRPDLLLGFSHHSIRPVSEVSRITGIPSAVKLFGVMYLARDDIPPPRRWWLNFDQERALRYPVDRYIALDDGTMGRKALLERGVPEEKISFLPNGMDMRWAMLEPDRRETRDRFGIPADRVVIATVSRLSKLKRVDLLLRAAALMDRGVLASSALAIAGDGEERGRLEDLAAELGLADRVTFTGALRYDEMPAFLKACDIFTATSDMTNLSMPPCEAMLCGLPVVAFDVAGTSAGVREGETGVLVEYGDLEGFAEALSRLVIDRTERERLGEGAARFAGENFMSWDERISREIEILERTAGGGSSSKEPETT